MKKFEWKKFKQGGKVTTRNGAKVGRIYKLSNPIGGDSIYEYPIVAEVEGFGWVTYSMKGEFVTGHYNAQDLFMVDEDES